MIDLLLFRGALRDLAQPKRLLAAAGLVALPAALVLFARLIAPPDKITGPVLYNMLAGGLIFGFTLVILAVVFGTGVVSQEVEGRTIVYLLTRPVARARVLLAKFLAAVVMITAAVWLSTLLLVLVTYGPAGLSAAPVLRDLRVLPVGVLAYGSLFLLMATALNRPLIYGLFFAFGWESWIPILPGELKKLTIMSWLRVLAPHADPPGAIPGRIGDLLSRLDTGKLSAASAREVLAGVILVGLAASFLIFSRREYAPRDDAE
jgi:ABC-2 type transport system permease protein